VDVQLYEPTGRVASKLADTANMAPTLCISGRLEIELSREE